MLEPGTTTRGEGPVLIEATCNQVNQFGGYTGMTPAEFVAYVHGLAAENDFPTGQLILGGDHLRPNVWQNEPAASAMQIAADMVRVYVKAGYTKIHLDATMKLGDDNPSRPLDVELATRRAAWLAKTAEACADPGAAPPLCLRHRSSHPCPWRCNSARGRRPGDGGGGRLSHAGGHARRVRG